MELFSILCDTCAARLRVTQPNAVGQVLACPKCSNMVHVVPPVGWEPTPAVVESLSSKQLSKIRASISGAGFDDIDDLLQTAPLPKKKRPSQGSNVRKGQPSKTRPQKRVPAVPSTAKRPDRAVPGEPVLPTGEWTSSQSRQRKKWLILFTALFATVIVIGGLAAAYFANAGRKTVANTPSTDPAPTTIQAESSANDATTPETEPEVSTDNNPETPLTKDNDSTETVEPAVTDPVPEIETPEPAQPTTGSEENPDAEPKVDILKPPSNPLASLPTEPEKVEKHDDIVARNLFGNPVVDDSSLGSLSELLDEANTSITELQDLASEIEARETIGISKYFIDRPQKLEIDITNKLGLPCAGLIAQGTPLISILREVTAMTGVPFAFDVENLRAAHIGFSLPIDIKMEQSEDHKIEFKDLVDEVISQYKLIPKRTADTNVVVLSAIDINQQQAETYSLPPLAQDPNLAERMVVLVKALIAPETWTRENNPGTIAISGHELTVNQTPDVHVQLRRFFDKLLAIEAGKPAQTRWATAQSALSKPPKLKHSLPLALEDLLTRIQSNTGVNVLVDWPELVKEGWNPTTIVPGEFNEATVGKALKEIARSMKLTLRAVDENTIEITTFRAVAARSEVELYFYGDIIEGTLTQDQVFDIVNQSLGRQFRQNPNVRMEYFPQVNCIVAAAPQTLHRQLELVLNRLRSVDP